MEFFRIHRDIPFMRYALFFNVISILLFLFAIFSLVGRGLNLSIEFTGGTVIEVHYDSAVQLDALRQAITQAGVWSPAIQHYGSSDEIVLRLAGKDRGTLQLAGQNVHTPFFHNLLKRGGLHPVIKRIEYVGPEIGAELLLTGISALLVACIAIITYVAMRFGWRLAISAILANLHDIIIILGFFAFFHWEFSLSVLAAILAVLGYSVNESVVVFDRVRETFRTQRQLTHPAAVLNHAITSTISRTIITHLLTQLMVLAMLVFGGETLHYFSLALTIGILFSIYSSVLVSSPIALWLGISRAQFVVYRKKYDDNDPNVGAIV